MRIELMTVKLFLPMVHSLKEKRSRVKKIREKWGKIKHLAVAESDYLDLWQISLWSFVAISSDKKMIDKTFAEIEQYMRHDGEYVVTDIKVELL